MKPCVVIPCYNHPATVAAVAAAARAICPVIVVDDGSTTPLPPLEGVTLVRLPLNQGKGAALRAGFEQALQTGFTHVITMDADGQHSAADLPAFLKAAEAQPDALVVGIRDFYAAGCPAGRRRSNAVSTFWFRVETGIRLGDTQCGFRCYPLSLVEKLRVKSGRYAFELEFMVRAAWLGAPIVPVPIACTYQTDLKRHSHFRPVLDLAHITTMNIGLVFQSWVVPRSLRIVWSQGRKLNFLQSVNEFFAEHSDRPARLAWAVGLGLFCGIVPIWGFQMLAAGTLAHLLKLNKAVALVASNISIPPIAPFILYGALVLGHWLFTREILSLPARQVNWQLIREYLGQWCIGSFVLGLIVAALGTIVTYSVARLVRQR